MSWEVFIEACETEIRIPRGTGDESVLLLVEVSDTGWMHAGLSESFPVSNQLGDSAVALHNKTDSPQVTVDIHSNEVL